MAGRFLTLEEQGIIVGMSKAGSSLSEISRHFGRPKKSISLVLKRYHERGSIQIAQRSGRPRKLQAHDRRMLKYEVQKNRRVHLAELASSLSVSVCQTTIRKELHGLGLRSRIAVKKPYLNDKHKQQRLRFAKAHQNWTIREWSSIIWSDEASFEIGKNSRQIRVWRGSRERYDSQCLVPTFKSGRVSIMVWGAFTATSKCYLVFIPVGQRTAMDFVDVVCEKGLLPYFYHHANYEHLTLMVDGAPIHTANVTKFWMQDNGLKTLDWPPNSPDLNPIENLWMICKDRVQSKNRPRNKAEMWDTVNAAWESISMDILSDLIATMPERMKAVIDAKGGSTRW